MPWNHREMSVTTGSCIDTWLPTMTRARLSFHSFSLFSKDHGQNTFVKAPTTQAANASNALAGSGNSAIGDS